MNNYESFYLVSLLLAIFIYFFFFYSRYHNKKIVKDKMDNKEITRLILINVFILIPIIAHFYIKEYNYNIPDDIKNLAPIIMLLALVCIIKTSYDLGNEYSYTLQLRKNHKLVDTGIYKYIRHPMYFCGLLFVIAQSLLIPNVIGNISNLISMYIFATGRIPDEENMMIKEFGNKYREYMKKTKSVIPFIL
jgi:protein-S-isoprenylcysteine O-methyltransferase Ste14